MRGGIAGPAFCCLLVLLLAVPGVSEARAHRSGAASGPALSANHDPILIVGDSAFTPANGVVGGNGSLADPFIIAGWEFLLTSSPGIEIRDTTAFFVLRDTRLVGTYDGAYDAVALHNVTNARIENVTSEANRIGVLMERVHSATVVGSWLQANQPVRVVYSTDVTIARNEAHGAPNGVAEVLVSESAGIDIDSNRIETGYGTSIGVDQVRDLRIVNNTIRTYMDGIVLDYVNGSSVMSNDVYELPDVGIWGTGFEVRSSANVSVTANSFRDFDENRVDRSVNISLERNDFPGYLSGLVLDSSTNVGLMNNSMDRGGIRIAGADVRDYDTHRIDATNTVAGRPIVYLHDCADLDLSGMAMAQLIAVNCQRIHVANASLANVSVGIHVLLSQQLIVENVSLVGAYEGVRVEASANLTVANNSMSMGAFGIHLLGSQGFLVEDNRLRNFPQGIVVEDGADGQIAANNVEESTNVALDVTRSQRLTVVRNSVTGNYWGIDVYGSEDLVAAQNTIALNQLGMLVDASHGVRVHHNEFIANDARDLSGSGNLWDDGYPSGGNYWSGYRGWDDCGGPAQDVCPGSDGLGDIPYELGGGVQDRYPLVPVNPPNEPPIATFSFAPARPTPGMPVTFDARDSRDPEGWPLRYTWDFGDGTRVNTTLPTIDHAFFTYHTFHVVLTVTDPRGGTSTETGEVIVSYAPVAVFSFDPSHPRAGESVRFDASASHDPDGSIVRFEWSLGDGSGYSPNAQVFWYTYAAQGAYVARLTVTDDTGFSSSSTLTIEVGPPAPLVLVPYEHPSEFRLPIPEGWSVREDVPFGNVTVALVLVGPENGGVQTNIIVDTAEDPTVRETRTYLLGLVNETVLEVRQGDPSTSVDLLGSPTLRRLANHAAVTFKLQYGTGEFFQKVAIVVSEAHRRYWVLVLTTDGQSYDYMDQTFERMLSGFVITRAPPTNGPTTTGPSLFGFPAAIILGGVAGAVVLVAVLVAVFLQRSRKAQRPPSWVGTPGLAPLVPTGPPPHPLSIRFCPACGLSAPVGAQFCPRCGTTFPFPPSGTSENQGLPPRDGA